MNIKRFTLLSAVLLIAAVSSFSWIVEVEKRYHPYDVVKTDSRSANNYIKFMEMVKADQQTGEVDPAKVFAARKQVDRMPKNKSAINFNWQFEGPDNIGGRTRALLIDKNNPDHLYAGGVAGGVFESTNGGDTWKPYDIDFKVSNISSITQGADGSIFVGTGGHFETGSSSGKGYFLIGTGIHKLTGLGNYEEVVSPNNRVNAGGDYATIGELEADPIRNNVLHVAMNNGYRLLEFNQGTNVWEESNPIPAVGQKKCNDIDISEDGQTIVVTFGNSFNGGEMYISNDGGASFFRSMPSDISTIVSRIEADIAPSDKNIIYAGIAGQGNTGSGTSFSCLVGIYRSKDGGQSWDKIQSGGIRNLDMYSNPGVNCQGFWDNMVGVYPDNSGKIVVGGVSLHRWEQSSVDPDKSNGSWSRLDVTVEFDDEFNLIPNYVHADKHEIVFDPRNSDVAYIATDGGVTKTTNFNDPFPTFRTHNFGYGVTQYYGMDVNAKQVAMGGTQDNGSHLINLKFNNDLGGFEVLGGDGFDAVLSSINPSLGVASSQFNNIRRIQGIGTTTSNSNISRADITSTNVFLGGNCNDPLGCSEVFYTAIELWESFNHEGSTDSVNLSPVRTDLPPIPAGKVLSFESNNNKVLQTYTLPNDIYPVDTVSGSTDKRVSFKVSEILAEGNALVMNFDTISIDTANKQLFVNRRALPYEVINYAVGVEGTYDNVFLNATGNTGVSYLVRYRGNDLYLEIENAEIKFAYSFDIQDKVQSIFASANWPGVNKAYSQRNIFITRDLLKGKTDIVWHNIAGEFSTPDPIRSTVLEMTFSPDGNHLYVGTTDGQVFRISDLDSVDTDLPQSSSAFQLYNIQRDQMAGKCRLIGRFPGRAVTSITIDPFDQDKMIVTLGNYSNGFSVARTTNARSIMDWNGAFEFIQGTGSTALPIAPTYSSQLVYSVGKQSGTNEGVRDSTVSSRLLIGNELGVFATDNPFDSDRNAVEWSEENSGLGRVPVFEITQMPFFYTEVNKMLLDSINALDYDLDNQGNVIKLPLLIYEGDTVVDINFIDSVKNDLESRLLPIENTASIYLATHGRGIYRSDALVGIREGDVSSLENSLKESILLYPNPVAENATLKFKTINTKDPVKTFVYNMKGQMVLEFAVESVLKGQNQLSLPLSSLENGAYILQVIQGAQKSTSKFIKH